MKDLTRRLLGRSRDEDDDPYWDAFIHRAPADPKNTLIDVITRSPGGGVFSPRTEVHDPHAMAGHLAQLSLFFGADIAGIAATDARYVAPAETAAGDQPDTSAEQLAVLYPRAIVLAVHWEYDLETARGMGGQFGLQKVAVANFHLRSYIREFGYEAVFARLTSHALAAAAGLGTLGPNGRLVTPQYGERVVLGDVVLTDMPLTPHS